MSTFERTRILRFFAVDLSRYSSYGEARLVVERSDPVPLRAPGFPYMPPTLTVFVTLLLDVVDLGGRHRFSLEWVGIDGNVAGRREEILSLPPDAVVSGSFPVSFVVNFKGLWITGPGTCKVRLGLDGEELETLPVKVGAEMAGA